MAMLMAQSLGGYSLVQIAILVVVALAVVGLVIVAQRQFGVAVPAWLVQVVWIVIAAVVIIAAIKFVAGL